MPAPDDPRDVAGVIAPPPLIFIGFLVLGLALSVLRPLPVMGGALSIGGRVAVGAAFVLAGIALAVAGLLAFHHAGTDVRPDRPTTALATTGPFGWSRNPLYVSQGLVYVGIALALDSAWALALLVPTLIVIRYGVIAREEAYLERRFGDAYRRYRARVRRWL